MNTMDEAIFGSPELFDFYSPTEVRETTTDFSTFESAVDGFLETVISETTDFEDPNEEGADLLHIISSSLDRFNELLHTEIPAEDPSYFPFQSQAASTNHAPINCSSNSNLPDWLSSEFPHEESPTIHSLLPSPSLESTFMQHSFFDAEVNLTNNVDFALIGQPPGLPRISVIDNLAHLEFTGMNLNGTLSQFDQTYLQTKMKGKKNPLESKWGSLPPDMVTLSSDSGVSSDNIFPGFQFRSSSSQITSECSFDLRNEDKFSQLNLRSPPVYVDCSRGALTSDRSPAEISDSFFSMEQNPSMQFNILHSPKTSSFLNQFHLSSGSTASLTSQAHRFQNSLIDRKLRLPFDSHSYPTTKELLSAQADLRSTIISIPKTNRTQSRPDILSSGFFHSSNGRRNAEPLASQIPFNRLANRVLPLRSNSVIIGQLGSPPISCRIPDQNISKQQSKSHAHLQYKPSANSREQKCRLNNWAAKTKLTGESPYSFRSVPIVTENNTKTSARRLVKSESVTSSSDSADAGKPVIAKWRRACSFYLRGHCKKEDCEFAHDLTKVTCKFWELGECFKGSTCPFLHGYPPELLENEFPPIPSTVLASSKFTAAVK